MLNDFEVVVKKEETDMVDSLRYSFQKLLTSAVSPEIQFQRFFFSKCVYNYKFNFDLLQLV